MRLKLLELLSFVPDKWMVKIQYRLKTGRKLNLKNPLRFTEKLQWIKLYDKNPLMVQCVDKYDVREYVKSKGLEKNLIPCYGVYNSGDEIDWDKLPDQFVMKDTLGGGGTSVIVVADRSSEDIEKLKAKCREWTSIDARKRGAGREWPYYSGKNHRIIIEKFIESDKKDGGLIDYKFMCLNGEIGCVYVLCDRNLANGAQCGIFDHDFNLLPYSEDDERPLTRKIDKPLNYDRMCAMARLLSREFTEARIDLYNQNGMILFGEITFFDSSGYMVFEPDEFDFILGEKMKLPCKNSK